MNAKRFKVMAIGLAAGLLFGLGLAVGGMTQPGKVIGFLDVFGDWDASLAFVMGGAVLTLAPLVRWLEQRPRPWFRSAYAPPPHRTIDARLLVGAAMFGAGWGIVGFCPGPAMAALGGLSRAALWVAPSMLVGMAAFELMDRVILKRPIADDDDAGCST